MKENASEFVTLCVLQSAVSRALHFGAEKLESFLTQFLKASQHYRASSRKEEGHRAKNRGKTFQGSHFWVILTEQGYIFLIKPTQQSLNLLSNLQSHIRVTQSQFFLNRNGPLRLKEGLVSFHCQHPKHIPMAL